MAMPPPRGSGAVRGAAARQGPYRRRPRVPSRARRAAAARASPSTRQTFRCPIRRPAPPSRPPPRAGRSPRPRPARLRRGEFHLEAGHVEQRHQPALPRGPKRSAQPVAEQVHAEHGGRQEDRGEDQDNAASPATGLRPSAMMLPQLGTVGGMPAPMNESTASSRIADAPMKLAWTNMAAAMLGKMWRTRIAGRARAAHDRSLDVEPAAHRLDAGAGQPLRRAAARPARSPGRRWAPNPASPAHQRDR